jgi:hypothetical protein
MTLSVERSRKRQAVTIERVTIAWTAGEAAGAVVAGRIAHSIALMGFGLDSVIEVVAAFAVYRRLIRELRFGADAAGNNKSSASSDGRSWRSPDTSASKA